MNQNWLNDQRLNDISWDKRTFLLNFMKEHKYNSKEEFIPLMMLFHSNMQNRNLQFTKEEQALLLDIMTDAMSPNEKQQFSRIMELLKRT